ncbi:17740_t:CDS:2, partial [Racocetra fulgida]
YTFTQEFKNNPTTSLEYNSTSERSSTEEGSTKGFALETDFSSNALSNKEEQTAGLNLSENTSTEQDWSKSFFGLSVKPFSKEVTEILLAPVAPEDIEIKPDGIIYLPEIKYRRILNRAFGPGVARGEQDYFDSSGLATATEGAKSNALMRCCKDLGIASELWDPTFIRDFKKRYCEDVLAEHVITKVKKRLWRKKGTSLDYPYK